MTEALFPFRIYYSDKFSGGPYDYREAFKENRPEFYEEKHGNGKYAWTSKQKFSCYQYEVIIHSQTEIEFICFDMEDFCYGGRGKEFHRFTAIVDKSVTKKSIERKLLDRATYLREAELAMKELIIIQDYADREAEELGINFD